MANDYKERMTKAFHGADYAGIRPEFDPTKEISDAEYEQLSPAEAEMYARYDPNGGYSGASGYVNWDRVPAHRREAYARHKGYPKNSTEGYELRSILYPNIPQPDALLDDRVQTYPEASGVEMYYPSPMEGSAFSHHNSAGPMRVTVDGMSVEDALNSTYAKYERMRQYEDLMRQQMERMD